MTEFLVAAAITFGVFAGSYYCLFHGEYRQ
jgi:hypothetical protein